MARFKARVRELTRRTRGRSLAQIIEELSRYLKGWRVDPQLPELSPQLIDVMGAGATGVYIYDDEMDAAYWPHEFSALRTVGMSDANLQPRIARSGRGRGA